MLNILRWWVSDMTIEQIIFYGFMLITACIFYYIQINDNDDK